MFRAIAEIYFSTSLKQNTMHLLSSVMQASSETLFNEQLPQWSLLIIGSMAAVTALHLSKKQKRKIKWQLAKEAFKRKFSFRKGKGDGAGIVMLLLLLIAGAAVLWILWELTGVFGLILGIVGGIALLSLIIKGD